MEKYFSKDDFNTTPAREIKAKVGVIFSYEERDNLKKQKDESRQAIRPENK